MKIYIVYKTTNLINGKIYIGKHVQEDTHEFDGYLGSGTAMKYAIKKYGKINFVRETLSVFNNESECLGEEARYISEYADQDGYNIMQEAGSSTTHNESTRKKLSDASARYYASGGKNSMLGRTHSEYTIELMKATRGGENNAMYNKKHTDETKYKMTEGKCKGYYITPWGKYMSLRHAATASPDNINHATLAAWFNNLDKKIKKVNVVKWNFFTEIDIGKTFKSVGFNYESI